MKKISTYLSMILIIFSLVGCNKTNESNNIEVNIGKSTKFTQEEINKAIDCLKSDFNLEACTLTKIYYDEEKSNTTIENYFQFGKGSENNVKPENVIALLSDFDVDDSGDNPILNAGETYTDYNWILIRDDKDSDWKIDDFGF